MKKNLLVFLFASSMGFCASPLVGQAEQIAAIFQSEKVINKMFSPIDSLVFKGHSKGVSQFALTSTEFLPIIDAEGVTVGHKPSPCLVLVDVIVKEVDTLFTVEVGKVDFTACPHTALNQK